jgi:Peptidase family M1 domain
VTKVLRKARGLGCAILIVVIVVMVVGAFGARVRASQSQPDKPAEALYMQLRQVGLDPSRVFQVRDAAIDRSAVHISLDDGTIAFTSDVMGRITGAFFEGDGEVLITPPNDVERRSMSLFTGMAILEEHFSTAYFRFNDDAAAAMRADLRATNVQQEFVDRWQSSARNLAQSDAMRLLMTFSRMLPSKGDDASGEDKADNAGDRFLHARVQGASHGVFDIFFDTLAAEQVLVGQGKAADDGITYYDIWASFAVPVAMPNSRSAAKPAGEALQTAKHRADWLSIRSFTIKTEVEPPKGIQAQARLALEVNQGGSRTMLFELSRFLQVESVRLDGEPVEFIQNPSVEGTQLSRQGNDFVAVILPQPARAGQRINLEFIYGGEVLAEAGGGLLYVGERGNWYPNRGLVMANFDLEFDYPPGWMLVATGATQPSAPSALAKAKGLESSRWVSERPIPVAGFNLGKYKVAKALAGNVSVETYATQAVERNFPTPQIQTIEPIPSPLKPAQVPEVVVPPRPSPAQNEITVGESAAGAIRYYSERFGPFPYSHLALTEMPGRDSQGWPGLVFLSSYAFLDDDDRRALHFEPPRIWLQKEIPAHETAHQWWGDLVSWTSYRDQWISEGLATYCALMMLQEKSPEEFHEVMDMYRRELVQKNKDGMAPKDVGPVTLGYRLISSRSSDAYEAISYGRGAWLFHMLRTMLSDAEARKNGRRTEGDEEPFVRVLRRVREQYQGKMISTRELMDAFAQELPPALRYEGKSSLDWFLDGWVNGTSLPTLQLSGVKIIPKGTASLVTATLLEKNAPPDLVTSVPLYAVTGGRQLVLLGRVFADGEESTVRILAPAGTRKIELDPYDTILTAPKK